MRGKPAAGLGTTHGARVMDSTPPPMASEASPVATARLAWTTASRPDPHSRLTVTPGTDCGSPVVQHDVVAPEIPRVDLDAQRVIDTFTGSGYVK